MLKGKAKVEYQREYMRNRRKKHLVRPSEINYVRPTTTNDTYVSVNAVFTPEIDADGNRIYE